MYVSCFRQQAEVQPPGPELSMQKSRAAACKPPVTHSLQELCAEDMRQTETTFSGE